MVVLLPSQIMEVDNPLLVEDIVGERLTCCAMVLVTT